MTLEQSVGGFGANARLALDLINGEPVDRMPAWLINPMEWRMIDRLAGVPEGSYQQDPETVFHRMYERVGVCMVDQWIPRNPLTMGSHGYDSQTERKATTGAAQIVIDGVRIDSPEAVVEHIEAHVLPGLDSRIAGFDHGTTVDRIIEAELSVQRQLGPNMLKGPYSGLCARFPTFMYGAYGYENYFMAYALFPDVMERVFARQADFATLYNAAAAEAIRRAELPRYVRLDHDMADGRGTLVDERTLDQIWFPHFTRAIAPLVDTGVRAIWHCDGNLMAMVPRLLEAGVAGFQGFQYEHGMDYEKICAMRTRSGDELLIIGGVSVTRTLPHGSPDDVKREMRFLVEHAPRRGLILGASSSITPGVPWENLKAFVDGLQYYRTTPRSRV
jgi:hypothetical protein